MFTTDNTEAAKEAMDIIKCTLKAMLEDPDVISLQAKTARSLYENYLTEGFTAKEAFELASLKAMK